MSYRGSLRHCIEQIAHRYIALGDNMLTILCNPKEKCYTACDLNEMHAIMTSAAAEHTRIVFWGTLREFAAFTTTNQLSLDFGDESDGEGVIQT